MTNTSTIQGIINSSINANRGLRDVTVIYQKLVDGEYVNNDAPPDLKMSPIKPTRRSRGQGVVILSEEMDWLADKSEIKFGNETHVIQVGDRIVWVKPEITETYTVLPGENGAHWIPRAESRVKVRIFTKLTGEE